MQHNYRCSWVGSMQGPDDLCTNPAEYVGGVAFGPWLMGLWVCSEHRKEFEQAVPLFYDEDGKPVSSISAMGIIRRQGKLVSLAELTTMKGFGERLPQPQIMLTCDKCSAEIFRYNGQWLHVGENAPGLDLGLADQKRFDHEAMPG